jgi:hypothetical protein
MVVEANPNPNPNPKVDTGCIVWTVGSGSQLVIARSSCTERGQHANLGTVFGVEYDFTLEDAIGSHACSLEARACHARDQSRPSQEERASRESTFLPVDTAHFGT